MEGLKLKLLVSAAFQSDGPALGVLTSLGHEVSTLADERSISEQEFAEAEGLVCNGLLRFHDIGMFPKVRFVQLTSAGFDGIDMESVISRGVQIFNAKGAYSIPMSEWALMQILNVYKKSSFFGQNQAKRVWEKNRSLREIKGLTACIIGYGSVGSEIAKRLKAFGVRVIGVRRRDITSDPYAEVIQLEELRGVLPEADIVVSCLPLNTETYHFVDASLMKLMKRDSVLVNLSRGGIVNTSDLLHHLSSGKFLGVALDVFEEEPLSPDSPLWGIERVIITPHNSFVSDGSRPRLLRMLMENLAQLGEGVKA